LLGLLQENGVRSLHEELAQIFVSSSAGTGELLLASAWTGKFVGK
jgi:hypothetical protein